MSVESEVIRRHVQQWWHEFTIAEMAESHLVLMEPGSARRRAAVERIARRRAQLLPLVEQACAIPVRGRAERDALQRLANLIEMCGSPCGDRDLELIEARLGRTIEGIYEVVDVGQPVRSRPVLTLVPA